MKQATQCQSQQHRFVNSSIFRTNQRQFDKDILGSILKTFFRHIEQVIHILMSLSFQIHHYNILGPILI